MFVYAAPPTRKPRAVPPSPVVTRERCASATGRARHGTATEDARVQARGHRGRTRPTSHRGGAGEVVDGGRREGLISGHYM